MEIEKIFRKIPQFKNIKLDCIFFESKYPILFTCICDENIYLFVCCTLTNNEIKWIGTVTNYRTLIKLLENKITIRDSLLMGSKKKFIINYDKNDVYCKELVKNEIPSYLLLAEGEYMGSEDGEYAEEISYLTKGYMKE